MCGSKGSPSTIQQGTTSSTGYGSSSTAADPFAAALYRNYLGGAGDVFNKPMTADQLSAASNLYSLGTAAGTFDPAKVAAIQSPFTENVVNATQRAFSNMNRMQANDLLSGAIRSGNAFGGDRAGVAAAALANQQSTAQSPIIAGLYQQGYGQALDEYNRLKAMGLQGGVAAMQGANAPALWGPQMAQLYASQLAGLGPLLGGTQSQNQTTQGTYWGSLTPPQPNPWVQGAGLGLTALGMFGGGGGSPFGASLNVPGVSYPGFRYRRGGLIPRRFQDGGALDLGTVIPRMELLRPAPQPQFSHMNLNAPSMPSIPGGGGGGGSGQQKSSGSNSGWADVASTAMKVLPMLLVARGGSIDVGDRGLPIRVPSTFWGPPKDDLPSTPDEFREKYGRDPATDHELEHYFGPAGSPLKHLAPEGPQHFQFGGFDRSSEVVPGLEGMTRGMFQPMSYAPAEPVQSQGGPDATVEPVSLGVGSRGMVFPRIVPTERASPEPKAIAGAYTPGMESDVPGLGIRAPTAAQSWATNPLTQAGLAMLGSRSSNFLTGIGEGLRGAQTALQQQRAADVELDKPQKMLTDGPTIRYQMSDGRIIDTKMPNPGYEEPEPKEEKAKREKMAKWKPMPPDERGRPTGFYNEETMETKTWEEMQEEIRKRKEGKGTTAPSTTPPVTTPPVTTSPVTTPPATTPPKTAPVAPGTPTAEGRPKAIPVFDIEYTSGLPGAGVFEEPPGAHLNPEALEGLSPDEARRVKAMAEGKEKWPPLTGREAKNNAFLRSKVLEYDPTADETRFAKRQRTANFFAVGTGQGGGNAINNMNTFGHHIVGYLQLAKQMDLGRFTDLNKWKNWMASKGYSSKETQDLLGALQVKQATVAAEGAKIFAGQTTALADREEWLKILSLDSPYSKTLKQAKALIEQIEGRLQGLAAQYNGGMDTNHDPNHFIAKSTRQIFDEVKAGRVPEEPKGEPVGTIKDGYRKVKPGFGKETWEPLKPNKPAGDTI